MISLRCPQCNREIEVSDTMRGMEIPCARCGRPLALAVPPADAAKTELGPPLRSLLEDDVGTSGMTNQSGMDETFTPIPKKPAEKSFAFLAPPKEPNELGWLAHYRVLRLLGQGGMGSVFEAVDTHLQRKVALKVMKQDLALDESARQRFLREARATAAVHSDHVITIHQVGEKNKLPYLAMEFLQGESLDKRLERQGRLRLAEILRLGIEIGKGLAAAHEGGLIHRDIKPGNVWLEGREESATRKEASPRKNADAAAFLLPPSAFRVKILDFGLARLTRERSNLTQSGMVMGTPAYMAPEQIEGNDVDSRCDLFSLGCILYEASTGRQPFGGPNSMATLLAVTSKQPLPPRELNPELPPPLAKLILQLLSKNPKNRPATASEVVEKMETIANALGIATLTPSSGTTRIALGSRPILTLSRRRKIEIGVALFSCVIIGGLTSWLLLTYFGVFHPATSATAQPSAVQGVSDNEILFGLSGPFSGPGRELGYEFAAGISTYFHFVNQHGGVDGRKLRLVTLDDGYDPARGAANLHALDAERKVFAIIGPLTPLPGNMTPAAAVGKPLLFFGGFGGVDFPRQQPPDRYVFSYRASLEEETAALVKYLVKERGLRPDQIAVFASKDRYGDEAFDGAAKAMRQLGRDAKDIVRVDYPRNTIHVDGAVLKVLKHPELRGVVMAASYKPATVFIQKVKDALPKMIFASVSMVGSEALAEGLLEYGPKYADGVIVSQVVPPVDSRTTLVLKYRALLRQYQEASWRPCFQSLEGYIDAVLLTEGLKKAGRDLTTETLIDALEKIDHFDIGLGVPITLGPSEHQASHKVWITRLDRDGVYRSIALEE